MRTVATVTPWLAHPELAEDFLEALEQGPWPEQAIVVDNGDAPRLPGCVVIRAGSNLGFSAASNLGLDRADTDIVVFVNNDIRVGWPGWLDRVRDAVEPGVLVGPLRNERHADVDGHQYPYLDGWLLGGMRDDLAELGGWDETFDEPSYFGDNDLCLRARAAGMTLRDLPAVGLVHKLNGTAGMSPQVQRATAANKARYQARVRELVGGASRAREAVV